MVKTKKYYTYTESLKYSGYVKERFGFGERSENELNKIFFDRGKRYM